MRPLFLIVFFLVFCVSGIGQNISVTFTGNGDANVVDSVTATNLTSGQKVTLPGNETLVLTVSTSNYSNNIGDSGNIYPNPFSNKATLLFFSQRSETVLLSIANIVGKNIAEKKAVVSPGENQFVFSVNCSGLYVISLNTSQGLVSHKILCVKTNSTENKIEFSGNTSVGMSNNKLKNTQSNYSLGYKLTDVIHYKCMSGFKNNQVLYTTIITDSPTSSKNYAINFVTCTDADGKNYPVVKIYNKIWMAENLAYLPMVHYCSNEEFVEKRFYVYGYDGTDIKEAKNTTNYKKYGVLYNWAAAMNGFPDYDSIPANARGNCPVGWHIPTISELFELSSISAEKIRSSTEWGNAGNNYTGFNCLPAGARNLVSSWEYNNSLGKYAFFWSATKTQTRGTIHAYRVDFSDKLNYPGSAYVSTNMGQSIRCVKN